MIAVALIALFAIAALSTVSSLADSAFRIRHALVSLSRERALAKAGFVPQVHATELRLRPTPGKLRFGTARPFARRIPCKVTCQLSGAVA